MIPDVLRPALRLYGTCSNYEVGAAIAQQLHLKMPSDVADSTWVLLAELAGPLADALHEGEILLDARPVRIAGASVANASMAEIVNAMADLGWSGEQLDRVQVVWLQQALRDRYADKLAPFVSRMMRRWEQAGYFALAS